MAIYYSSNFMLTSIVVPSHLYIINDQCWNFSDQPPSLQFILTEIYYLSSKSTEKITTFHIFPFKIIFDTVSFLNK
jgi:hypothetical protein